MNKPGNKNLSRTNISFSHEETPSKSSFHADQQESTQDLIPQLYDQLRRLASNKIANERKGHTLQATALVHEAYLKISDSDHQNWQTRRHFFGAAAEAMRRILIDHARKKNSIKRGGHNQDLPIIETIISNSKSPIEILDINDALKEFEQVDPETAELVKLRFFVGLTMSEVCEIMNISRRKAHNLWAFARVWLYNRLND